MISTENIFLKNDFPETILRRKSFYAETNGALKREKDFCGQMINLPVRVKNQNDVSKTSVLLPRKDMRKRNDLYTHFSQQLHNKLMWLVIFYCFFTKTKQNKTKK
jgi:hypothetical protein